jgi:hypothetical protein
MFNGLFVSTVGTLLVLFTSILSAYWRRMELSDGSIHDLNPADGDSDDRVAEIHHRRNFDLGIWRTVEEACRRYGVSAYRRAGKERETYRRVGVIGGSACGEGKRDVSGCRRVGVWASGEGKRRIRCRRIGRSASGEGRLLF